MTAVERIALFPIEQYWWFYLAFTGAVLLLLVVDLGLFHRKAHTVSFSEAGTWVFVWVALALLFCYGLYSYSLMAFANDPRLMAIAGFDPGEAASQVALEFLTGYVLEESLSVDNMFVFVVVFGFFGIPQQLQHRVLFYGIVGALVFRALFIALGTALLQFQWMTNTYFKRDVFLVPSARVNHSHQSLSFEGFLEKGKSVEQLEFTVSKMN